MTRPMQIRILGLLALLALGIHGGVALGHDHDSAVETECIVCSVQQITALAVEPDPFESRLSVPGGTVADEAPAVARETLLACCTSRGPPA